MDAELRPFRIDVPDDDLADLRDRLARTRWPEAETVDDWTQGIPLAYTRELCPTGPTTTTGGPPRPG